MPEAVYAVLMRIPDRWRARIARHLRDFADEIHRDTAPLAFGGYWNHTPDGIRVVVTEGIQVGPRVPGCPLWYMADDYDRAWEGMPHAS
ncbi:hypothetical protein [Nocardia puris]|uniref:hypothetical protein n=1 Tax=Nocardia puris TaxID=208602 RepID=UPI002E1F0F1C